MPRSQLTDQEYALLEPLLPPERPSGKAGRPFFPTAWFWGGIFWIHRTGAPWRDLPSGYGKWSTVYERFRRWRISGLLQRILDALEAAGRKAERIDFEFSAADGSTIRAHRCAAGALRRGGGARKPGTTGVGTLARRFLDENPCLVRRRGSADLRGGHAGGNARSHHARGALVVGAYRRQGRCAAPALRDRLRRQGIRRRAFARGHPGARFHAPDPASETARRLVPGGGRGIRQRPVQTAQRCGTSDRQAQGVPPRRHAIRQTGRKFSLLRAHRFHSNLAKRPIIGHSLVQETIGPRC